jgi:hypothetical protein
VAAARRRRRASAIHESSNRDQEEESSDSDQEEDSDQVVNSDQQENRPPSASSSAAYASAEMSSDDSDENTTAIGIITNDPFVPRPNTFSLPQTQQNQHASHPQYGPRPPYRAAQRHSYPANPQQHSPFNAIAPSHNVDHDAALRASLSTLLSYANAARSLPKGDRTATSITQRPQIGGNRIEVATLGLVPESVALGVREDVLQHRTEPDVSIDQKKTKQKAEGDQRSTSKERTATRHRSRSRERSSKKTAPSKRTTTMVTSSPMNMEAVSPTLLTWIVGAGMIVLVSAISFSAGYVVGREAGTPPPTASGGSAAPTVEEMSESMAAVTSSLTGNVSSGGMRRNLASKATGGVVGQGVMAGLGWGNVVGAAS